MGMLYLPSYLIQGISVTVYPRSKAYYPIRPYYLICGFYGTYLLPQYLHTVSATVAEVVLPVYTVSRILVSW